MDNKLSELSKPVATVDVQRGRMDGNTFAVAWSSAGHALPDGPHFIYSQEYVSALLAELKSSQAIADEYQQLMYHMDAGGDFYEFQRDKAGEK
ncbi:hypothetical protein [Serratia ureilytica]|uniref:hypothetical protein n=1 Tax=Serratia ureilytica TaxID=300181 RepID=UPI0018669D7A|nr:hypothetical protein [Serratia ureilytica]